MLIFRGQGWAVWGYVHRSREARGMSGGGCGQRGGMLIFRVQGWAVWGYFHRSREARGMSGGGCGRDWACSCLDAWMPGCLDAWMPGWMSRQRAGTMSIPCARRRTGSYAPDVGRATGEHAQPLMGLRGMFRRPSAHCGACSYFAGRTGRNGTMSSPCVQRGACPPEEPRVGVGGLNWAKPESSGILVSAFDSEATGEFA